MALLDGYPPFPITINMDANATTTAEAMPPEVDLIDITETAMSDLYPNNPLNIYLHQLVVYAMSVDQLISIRDRMKVFKDLGILDGAAGALDLINNVLEIKQGSAGPIHATHAICSMLS
jgi:hypothetical protein